MTEDQTKLQQIQDMLQGSINQRNASQNECLQLAAQVAALSRDIEAARKELADLKKAKAADEAKPNGAEHAAAA